MHRRQRTRRVVTHFLWRLVDTWVIWLPTAFILWALIDHWMGNTWAPAYDVGWY